VSVGVREQFVAFSFAVDENAAIDANIAQYLPHLVVFCTATPSIFSGEPEFGLVPNAGV
jgi:hypothetical protein